MLQLRSEIIPIPMDEFTLNAPTKQVGGFLQGKKPSQKNLLILRSGFILLQQTITNIKIF
jgi:hypothetical protein